MIFIFGGVIKDLVYVYPLSADLPELKFRNEAVVATINPDTSFKVWEELAYWPIDLIYAFWNDLQMVLTLNTL